MTAKSLNFQAPLSLAIAEGATSPDPGLAGVQVWSSTLGKFVYWDGAQWTAGSAASGGVVVSETEPASPYEGMEWLDTTSGIQYTRVGTSWVSFNGDSAYELAVADGFSGTIEDWLASLQGDPTLSADLIDPGVGKGSNLVAANPTLTSGSFTTVQGAITLMYDRAPWVDLRAGLDAIHGAGSWTQRSAPGVGTDISSALVHLLDNTPARLPIYIPPGSFRYVTPVAASKLSGRKIFGAGSQASGIVFDSNFGVAFNFSGSTGLTGGGISGISIHLDDSYPTSTAQAIRLEGDDTYQPDQMVFEDIYISAIGTSYWNAGFFAYGNVRILPQGIRVGTIKNLQIFKCSALGAYFSNVVQLSAENVGVYSGTGAGQDIYIAGGGSSPTNSTQVYMRGISCVNLNVTNTSDFEISGKFTTFATATSATNGRVLGFGSTLSGTLGTNVTLLS